MQCAQFVRDGADLCDVGTDHAYLPIYLKLSGKVKNCIAVDINEGPLERARAAVLKFSADDIDVRQSNGLSNVSETEADDFVIAGMGGELIAEIINNAPFLKNSKKHLILQPMTQEDKLRLFLQDSLFDILNEKTVISAKKPYTVILCCYSGERREYSCLFPYIGLISGESESDREYIEKIIQKLSNKLSGYQALNKRDNAAETQMIIEKLKEKENENGL